MLLKPGSVSSGAVEGRPGIPKRLDNIFGIVVQALWNNVQTIFKVTIRVQTAVTEAHNIQNAAEEFVFGHISECIQAKFSDRKLLRRKTALLQLMKGSFVDLSKGLTEGQEIVDRHNIRDVVQ